MKSINKLLILFSICLFVLPVIGNAEVILGNIPPPNNNVSATIGVDFESALSFTMPATPYLVENIVLRLAGAGAGGGPPIVTLRADDNDGDPGTVIHTFTNPAFANNSNIIDYIFPASGTLVLQTNTKYWILVDHATNASSFAWYGSRGNNTPTGVATFGEYKFSTNNGGDYSTTTFGDRTFQLNGTSSFTLPVELASFGAGTSTSGVELQWSTSSEVNNEGFEIQRSLTAHKWETLHFVPGKGSTQTPQKYSYIDIHPARGLNYYRLKQLDHDGAFEYSDIVNVFYEDDDSVKGISVFPNPVPRHGLINVYLPSEKVTLNLHNILGKLILRKKIPEITTTSIVDTQHVPPGTYWLEVIAIRERWVEKVVIK